MNRRLDEIRIHLGLNKKDFSKELGITPNAYTNYTKGKRKVPIEVIEVLGNKFNICTDWFILGKKEMVGNTSPCEVQLAELRTKLETIKSCLQ